MSFDFNVGKINTIETDENEDEETNESKNKGSDELKNKLIKLGVFIGGGLILLLVVLFISSLFTKKAYSYEEIESILKNAAISYFKDYPDSLPKTEKQVAQITAETLITTGKMQDLTSYTKKGVNCDGRVEVSKRSNEYVYTPYLSCGDSYSSTKLITEITSDSKVVKTGYGMYKTDNEYIFRGETVDNYIKLDNALWRIIKVDSNDNIILILDDLSFETAPWDNRYNAELKYNTGVNNFSSSRVKERLQALYNNEILNNEKQPLLSNNDKTKIVEFNLCTGKRSLLDKTSNNSTECKVQSKNTRLGLLTVSDYMSASIDSNCNQTNSKSCQNYNYLNNKKKYWLVTAKDSTTNQVYCINDNGIVEERAASDYAYIRPVIYLNSNTILSKGSGTKEDPFIIK